MRVCGRHFIRAGRTGRLIGDQMDARDPLGVTEPIGMERLRQFNMEE